MVMAVRMLRKSIAYYIDIYFVFLSRNINLLMTNLCLIANIYKKYRCYKKKPINDVRIQLSFTLQVDKLSIVSQLSYCLLLSILFYFRSVSVSVSLNLYPSHSSLGGRNSIGEVISSKSLSNIPAS